MPVMKGLLAPQNTFLDTIATRFDGTRELPQWHITLFCLQKLFCVSNETESKLFRRISRQMFVRESEIDSTFAITAD